MFGQVSTMCQLVESRYHVDIKRWSVSKFRNNYSLYRCTSVRLRHVIKRV